VPDDGSFKLKHVVQYYVTLQQWVGLQISVVCKLPSDFTFLLWTKSHDIWGRSNLHYFKYRTL